MKAPSSRTSATVVVILIMLWLMVRCAKASPAIDEPAAAEAAKPPHPLLHLGVELVEISSSFSTMATDPFNGPRSKKAIVATTILISFKKGWYFQVDSFKTIGGYDPFARNTDFTVGKVLEVGEFTIDMCGFVSVFPSVTEMDRRLNLSQAGFEIVVERTFKPYKGIEISIAAGIQFQHALDSKAVGGGFAQKVAAKGKFSLGRFGDLQVLIPLCHDDGTIGLPPATFVQPSIKWSKEILPRVILSAELNAIIAIDRRPGDIRFERPAIGGGVEIKYTW